LGKFFASKSQGGGATPLPESVRGWRMSPRPPLYPPLVEKTKYLPNVLYRIVLTYYSVENSINLPMIQ